MQAAADIQTSVTSERVRWFYPASFALLVLLLLLTRAAMFFEINLGPIDSDQPFMWIGASDYAKGHFYEPRFYGQDYNTFMEGLFAVPFIWCGVPEYVAVPLASQLIWLFPVLFTTCYMYRAKLRGSAITALSFFLLMPVEYDMMSSVPRGFVTGLFFCSFYIISVLHPSRQKWMVVNALMAVAGWFVNPNSIIVTGPFMLFLLFHHFRDRRFYIKMALCALTAIPWYLLLDLFYKNHPDYIMHGLYYEILGETFFRNIAFLPRAFGHLSLIVPGMPVYTFLALAALAFLLWRSYRPAFWAYVSCFALVLASCISNKTQDGIEWPFYSFSRMYLGVPIVFMLFVSHIRIHQMFAWILVGGVVAFTAFKYTHFKASVARNLSNECWLGVHLVPLNEVLHAIEFYGNKCHEKGVNDLVISNPFWLSSYLAYGGPALHEDYPWTHENNNERRYWIRKEGETKRPKRLIYISCKSDIDKVLDSTDFRLVRLDDYGLFLVEDNRLTICDLIEVMKSAEAKLH